jgi:RsiW-degrading membrane proteinase PrsW (M82 family)
VSSVAGVVGPSLVGLWFDLTGTKRGLFVLLAIFLSGAFALLATLAPGFGEAAVRAPVTDEVAAAA